MNIWNAMEKSKIYGDGRHSAATSLPCLASLGHLTADKREIKDFPKILHLFLKKSLLGLVS